MIKSGEIIRSGVKFQYETFTIDIDSRVVRFFVDGNLFAEYSESMSLDMILEMFQSGEYDRL